MRQDADPQTAPLDLMRVYGVDGTPVLERVHAVIKEYAYVHSTVTNLLRDLDRGLSDGSTKPNEVMAVLEHSILKMCRDFMLPEAARKIEVTKYRHEHSLITDMKTDLFHILLAAIDDGKKLMLFPVDSAGLGYYEKKELFTTAVADKFVDAQKDLTEAGTCYALGRHTACVLHLMRALESALHVFAKILPSPFKFEPTDAMGQVASKIEEFIPQLPSKPQIKLEFKNRVRAVTMHFQNITKTLRNPAMHTGEFYCQEDAHNALAFTRLFFNELSTIVKKPRRRRK